MNRNSKKVRENEMQNNHIEHVVLPSDAEARRAKQEGKNYTKMRSGRAKVYSQEELEIFAKNHPESSYPFSLWDLERKWYWLVNSKGCKTRG